MSGVILYNGSDIAVPEPQIRTNGHYKDFGYGFYCTNIKKQAVRWALTRGGKSVLNRYLFAEDKRLKSLCFPKMTDSWLDFIVHCRRGFHHSYDIVEGPMADDTIWDFVEDFANGRIKRQVFWSYAEFKYPTHQIVFCTEKALRCLSFAGSKTL